MQKITTVSQIKFPSIAEKLANLTEALLDETMFQLPLFDWKNTSWKSYWCQLLTT